MISRRSLISAGAAFCTYALLREARAVMPGKAPLSARQWINRQTELATGLASGSVSELQWHDAVNGLAAEVDLEDISRMIRHAVTGTIRKPELHEPERRFIAVRSDDGVQKLPYGVAVFDFAEKSLIAPHAHKNMASAHMVMEGRMRIRTYNRLADDDGSVILRPSGDVVADSGHAAAMTPEHDNVHWFVSASQRAMTIDVVIAALDKTLPKPYEIQPIDAMAAEHFEDGTMRVPFISFDESRQKYNSRL